MNFNLAALEDGTIVLMVGFFIVFMFLSIMIVTMNISQKVIEYINKLCPLAAKELIQEKKAPSGADEEVAVALAAAILKQNHQ